METQRKDVKNLLYSKRLLMMMILNNTTGMTVSAQDGPQGQDCTVMTPLPYLTIWGRRFPYIISHGI